jgi:hypothetical protein
MSNYVMQFIIENDPNFDHSTRVTTDVCNMTSFCKEMLWEKKLQTKKSTLGAFFKKKADSYLENEPELGPFSST